MTEAIPQSPPRLLILGGGAVVTEFYLPALERLGWTRGIQVADLATAVLAEAKQRFPWIETKTGGYAELLASPGLRDLHDAVVVALPNSLHFAAVSAALNAGLPVLCEKPLTLRQADCEALALLAEQRGQPLVVGMVRRLSQAARTVREALEQGLIGSVKAVHVEHGGPYAWTSASGAFFRRENGGILADLGVHHLDWLGSLLEPLSPVSYEDDARGGVEASCRYALATASGVQVKLHLSHLHPLPNTTTFIGDKGSLVLGKDDFASCQWLDSSGLLRGELRREQCFDDASWPPDFLSCFAQQFVNFGRVIKGRAAEHVTAREAAATMGLIEHAYAGRGGPAPDVESRPGLPAGRTVITGGTGFIGTALAARLTGLGFTDIVVPVRGYRTCAAVARYPVQLPQTDLTNRDVVRQLIQGARWVFHLAYGRTVQDAMKLTVEGTRILVEEAEKAGVEAVVVLSTSWVYGADRNEGKVDESAPYAPRGGHYGESKAAMQKWCLARAASMTRTRLVLLNPACVYGPEGATYTRLPFELVKAGSFTWVDGGSGTAPLVYIDNLVDAMLHVAADKAAHGRNFIVCDDTSTWREFLSPLLGVPPDSVGDHSGTALEKMEAADVMLLSQVVKDVLRVPSFRRWIRERWVVRKARPYLPARWFRPKAPSQAAAGAAQTPPAPWLRLIYGPSKVGYSSQRLRSTGWQPLVTPAEGRRRTLEWLRSTHPGF